MFESEDIVLIGVFKEFFHCWKAEIMASYYGRCLEGLCWPLRFYATILVNINTFTVAVLVQCRHQKDYIGYRL